MQIKSHAVSIRQSTDQDLVGKSGLQRILVCKSCLRRICFPSKNDKQRVNSCVLKGFFSEKVEQPEKSPKKSANALSDVLLCHVFKKKSANAIFFSSFLAEFCMGFPTCVSRSTSKNPGETLLKRDKRKKISTTVFYSTPLFHIVLLNWVREVGPGLSKPSEPK